MRPATNSPSGAGVAALTLVGFLFVVVFAAAVGGYIGRHSTAPPVADETPSPSVSAPAQPQTPNPNAAMPAPDPAPTNP